MNKNLLIDHTKLVMGQKLWDIRYGEVIFRRNNNDTHYPLVCYGHRGEVSYSLNGKLSLSHQYPSLFLSNPFEQVNEFPKMMEVTDNDNWKERLVLYFDSERNRYRTLNSTNDSIIVDWQYAREIQKPVITEYTIEEIAIKLGVNPNTIRIKK